MKRVIAALLLFATMNVAAEVRSFGPLRPISVERSGLLAKNLGVIFGDWRSAAGRDGTVLFLWRDDRHRSPYDGAVHRQGTMAIGLGADGTPLDEFPLFLPFNPAYPVWRGNEWVVVGEGATARVSAEGKLLELRAQPELDYVYGIAWTGSVFIALTRDYTTNSARLTMLDGNLDVFSVDALPDTYRMLNIAGDGESSALLLTRPSGVNYGRVRATVFNRFGELRGSSLISETIDAEPTGTALAVGAGRYAVLLSTSHRLDAMIIGANLAKSPVGPLLETYFLYDGRLTWDGSVVTAYSSISVAKPALHQLAAARFTTDGHLVRPTEILASWPNTDTIDIASGGSSTLLLHSSVANPRLGVYSFHDPRELKANVPLVEPGIERGVFPQEFPAGASGTSQSLVSWNERVSPSDSSAVFATRLDRDGKVLDPESLFLGTTTCHGSAPRVASNGRDFLTVFEAGGVMHAAAVHADGTSETKTLPSWVRGTCVMSLLTSNGEDYLFLWSINDPTHPRRDLFATRVRADGTALDTAPIEVAHDVPILSNRPPGVGIASDGRDYLVAYGDRAKRITREGALINGVTLFNPKPDAVINRVWWNGRTYIVQFYDEFVHVRSDGTLGAAPPSGNETLRSSANDYTCDSGGCSGIVTLPSFYGGNTTELYRLDDDGTNVVMHWMRMPDFISPSPWPTQLARSFALDAGRLISIFTITRTESPYDGVQRIFVSTVDTPRARAVRH
jgi:hypothetical protein